MLDESIISPFTSISSLVLGLKWILISKIALEFGISCLEEDKITFTHENVSSLFVVYAFDIWLKYVDTKFTLVECSFGTVVLITNDDPGKYGSTGYGIGFDLESQYFLNDKWGKDIIILGVDNK